MNTLVKIYLTVTLLFDLALDLFFIGVAISGAAAGKDIFILAAALLTFFLLTAVTAVTLFRAFKNKEGHLVRNSLLMEACIFFTCMSVSFLAFDNLTACLFFLFIGAVLIVVTVYVIKRKPCADLFPKPVSARPYTFTYKGKWEWDGAAAEYMRLRGITDFAALTDEENDKIYDYTATPFSYLFYWLADSGFLSEEFYTDFETDNFAGKMKARKMTPVEVLAAVDYYFGSEYLLPGVIPFVRSYYDTEDRITGRTRYLTDYLAAAGNPEGRYYCIDFSYEILDQLIPVIEERYAAWNKELDYSDAEWYDDREPVSEKVRSSLFDASLNVYKGGIRRNGFLDINADAYLTECMKDLDSLPDEQIRQLERLFDGDYGTEETPEATSIAEFHPDTLYLMEPQNPGDIVYVVSGSASFEPEHGISFTVRNGLVIDWGYAYDFDDPYSEKCKARYEALSSMKMK